MNRTKVAEKPSKLSLMYPAEGQLSREHYGKHLEFFEAGKKFLERAAIAGNRTGKTTMSTYEISLHLTGEYPDWWNGRRFNRAVDCWMASDTGETTRDILQFQMLGPKGYFGTGMIPKENIIGDPTSRRGIADAVDTVRVRHKTGGVSFLGFKSYDQGREKFQGTKKDIIGLDEEPDGGVYSECLTRLVSTVPGEEDGTMICTFTPLKGMSAVVLTFLNEPGPTKFVLTMGMNHVPHLSAETKDKFLSAFPQHEREARMDGTPKLGAGAIYASIPESEFLVQPFEIPKHYARCYAMDVGWNRTAAIWLAHDRDTDIVYLNREYYRGQAEPSIHAQAIKDAGAWIPGVIDPASRGKSQIDGQKLMEIYQGFGLDLDTAFNGVESGIYEVQQRLATGRLKVFSTLTNYMSEFRLYRRDEKGKVVKTSDHLMDAKRYGIMSGLARAITEPIAENPYASSYRSTTSWMG